MGDSWVLAVTSAVTFLGALVPAFAELAGRPIKRWQRMPRVLVTGGLLAVSAMTGWASWREREASAPTGAHAAAAPSASATAAPTAQAPQRGTVGHLPRPVESPPVSPPARRIAITPRVQIADGNGKSVPQLVAAANGLRREYALTGVLQERSEQAPELQDLYTVHLTLNVTVTQRREVVAAFSVRSRGGGFQIEAARAQALDRLAAALQERVTEIR